MCNCCVLLYRNAICKDSVFYCTLIQCVMLVCLFYSTAACNYGVFYSTVLQRVMVVCFIIRY